ncbi:OB-fold-containig protein [Streptomyces sp. YIM 98790]|uniref:OB-fold-containig protein n=1 Tax=Streptomyces sp. YIM 98790 TaxID=2689077 RepID=UPI001409E967|nr:OB-fold-containig protein [Streptomyces sp. YIM 98790]
MGEFFDAALEFPTVVFTFPLVIVIGYWLFAAVTGVAGSAFDGADTGTGDAGDAGEASSSGGFAGLLAGLGLGGVPVTVVFSLVIAVAWFTGLVGTALFDSALILLPWLALMLYAAWQATWLLARPLRRILRSTSSPRNADFVGRVCLVRVGCAGETFGQAEITLDDGSTVLVDIRGEDGGEPIPAGSSALIFDYDPEGDFFRVAPAGAAADPLG